MTAESLLPLAIAECIRAACELGVRDVEEAESLAGVALHKAMDGFDPARGSIKARVAYKAWNEVRMMVRGEARRAAIMVRTRLHGDTLANRTSFLDRLTADLGEEARSCLRSLLESPSPKKYLMNMPEWLRSEIEEALE